MKLDSYNLYDKMVLKDFRFSIKQMKTEFKSTKSLSWFLHVLLAAVGPCTGQGPDSCLYNLLHLFTLNMYVVSDFYQFILSEKLYCSRRLIFK